CFEDLRDLFDPIRSQCIGLLTGNHEETLRLRQSQDIHGALCLALRVPNLGYDALLRWTFRRGLARKSHKKGNGGTVMKILASHSTVASRTNGGKLNRMEQVSNLWEGVDLFLFGHGHSLTRSPFVRLGCP